MFLDKNSNNLIESAELHLMKKQLAEDSNYEGQIGGDEFIDAAIAEIDTDQNGLDRVELTALLKKAYEAAKAVIVKNKQMIDVGKSPKGLPCIQYAAVQGCGGTEEEDLHCAYVESYREHSSKERTEKYK